jgi:hypothetical protein
MAQKKPASSAGVDSACKNKHMNEYYNYKAEEFRP